MKNLYTTLFAVAILAFSFNASAATVSFFLDQSNEPTMTQGINYAAVTISDGENGDIDFIVDINEGAFDTTNSSNFGMQTFSFNYDTSSAASGITVDNIDNIIPATWGITQGANAGGGFGFFEFELAGTGSTRTSLFEFSIVGIDGDNISDYALGIDGGEFFAAHIADFGGYEGFDSAQFAGSTPGDGNRGGCDFNPNLPGCDVPAVPVPAAVWLFGSGLLGLVGIARRKDVA